MSSERFFQDLRGAFQPALNTMAGAFTASLGRNTLVQMGEIRPVEMAELQADFPGQIVMISMDFLTQPPGQAVFLASTGLAAIWGDLMLSGDGRAEFSGEAHLDATAELLNQVGGALGQNLSQDLNSNIELAVRHCELAAIAEKAEMLESYFRIDFFVKLDPQGQALLTLLLSPEAAQGLRSAVEGRVKTAGDRPASAGSEEALQRNGRPEVRPARFEDFGSPSNHKGGATHNIDMLMDLELPVIIELGRSSMFIRDILELGPGSIVELNKLSGEPVDLYVNDKKFALGEVVVIDENFGIRITDLVKVEDRIRSLK